MYTSFNDFKKSINENIQDDDDNFVPFHPEEKEIIDAVVAKLQGQSIEDKSVIFYAIGDMIKQKGIRYSDEDDYYSSTHNMAQEIASQLKATVYDDVLSIEEFQKMRPELGEPKVGMTWTLHYGAPGYGSTTYKIEKIENNKIYANISDDNSGILSPSDVI